MNIKLKLDYSKPSQGSRRTLYAEIIDNALETDIALLRLNGQVVELTPAQEALPKTQINTAEVMAKFDELIDGLRNLKSQSEHAINRGALPEGVEE